MKFIRQRDYADVVYPTRLDTPDFEAGQKTTVRSSGCGLCAAVNAVDRLLPNVRFELEDAMALSFACGANRGYGTNYNIYAPALAEKFRLRFEVSTDPERLRECLRTGGVGVVLWANFDPQKESELRPGGHFVVAVSEEPDGRIAVLDSAYSPGKFDRPHWAGKVEMTQGDLALMSMETLAAESAPKAPNCFRLFWRA